MVPWHLIELDENSDIAWDIWQQMFLGIADYHAPRKEEESERHRFSLDYSRTEKA